MLIHNSIPQFITGETLVRISDGNACYPIGFHFRVNRGTDQFELWGNLPRHADRYSAVVAQVHVLNPELASKTWSFVQLIRRAELGLWYGQSEFSTGATMSAYRIEVSGIPLANLAHVATFIPTSIERASFGVLLEIGQHRCQLGELPSKNDDGSDFDYSCQKSGRVRGGTSNGIARRTSSDLSRDIAG